MCSAWGVCYGQLQFLQKKGLNSNNAVVIFFLNLKAGKALTDHQLQHENVANAAGEKPVPAERNSTISSMLSFNAR